MKCAVVVVVVVVVVLTAGCFVAAVQTVCLSVAHVDRTEASPIVASHPVTRTFYSQHTLAALIHRCIPMTNRSTANQRERERERERKKERKKESLLTTITYHMQYENNQQYTQMWQAAQEVLRS